MIVGSRSGTDIEIYHVYLAGNRFLNRGAFGAAGGAFPAGGAQPHIGQTDPLVGADAAPVQAAGGFLLVNRYLLPAGHPTDNAVLGAGSGTDVYIVCRDGSVLAAGIFGRTGSSLILVGTLGLVRLHIVHADPAAPDAPPLDGAHRGGFENLHLCSVHGPGNNGASRARALADIHIGGTANRSGEERLGIAVTGAFLLRRFGGSLLGKVVGVQPFSRRGAAQLRYLGASLLLGEPPREGIAGAGRVLYQDGGLAV